MSVPTALRREQVRVMVVEDHPLLAQSLAMVLTAEGMAVALPPLDVPQILAAAERQRPRVVLLDLDLGESGGDGSTLIEPLTLGGAAVMVVTGSRDRSRLGAAVESGACAVLQKSVKLDELLDAVRRLAAGVSLLPDAARQDLLTDLRRQRRARAEELAPFASLTPRERFVLSALLEGRSAMEIAADAYVSEATVRSQIRGVLTKLGVSSQLAAVALARRVRWADPGTLTSDGAHHGGAAGGYGELARLRLRHRRPAWP